MRKSMAVFLVMAAASCTGRKAAPTCPAGQTLCGGACVRLATDHDDCGACGTVCAANEVCTRGACVESCPPGLVACGGGCIDPSTSNTYCGATADCQGAHAGTACGTGTACVAGACSNGCGAGLLDCGGRCIDPKTSAAYCGATADCQGTHAGTPCGGGKCVAGACRCRIGGQILCDGTCVDPRTSTGHCGASADCQGTHAGTPCGGDEACVAGTCENDDASLSSLTLSAGFIRPAFDPGTLLYTAEVGLWVSAIEVTPTAAGAGATVEVDGTAVASGQPSAPIPLTRTAAMRIAIRVTAASGATRTYALVLPGVRITHQLGGGVGGLGASVAVDGDTVAEGGTGSYGYVDEYLDDGQGALSLRHEFVSPNSLFFGFNFGTGTSVALEGDVLVSGEPTGSGGTTGVTRVTSFPSSALRSFSSGAAWIVVPSPTSTYGLWYVKASNTGAKDLFGSSVAISGDTVVVGAPHEDSNATGVDGNQQDNSATDSGAAYVYARDATGAWHFQAYLKPSNTRAGFHFGASVAVSGDTVVVGAPAEDGKATGVNGDQTSTGAANAGAAYVFVRDATGTWSQQAYLKASNTAAGYAFGASVGVSGDTVAVGSPGVSRGYVFVRDASGTWSQQAYLQAGVLGQPNGLGYSSSISGGLLVMGAPYESSNATGMNGDETNTSDPNAGAAFVFERDATGTWTQVAYLKATNTTAQSFFGTSVSTNGARVVVGAPKAAGGGGAYVY